MAYDLFLNFLTRFSLRLYNRKSLTMGVCRQPDPDRTVKNPKKIVTLPQWLIAVFAVTEQFCGPLGH